jgi:DNA-binding response OmpR family regulator
MPLVMKILMVEDDFDLGSILVDILKDRGHEVEWVRTVAEGKTHLQAQPPEVLLLDREVFGLDGWALREVVSEAVRVVLMTGSKVSDATPHYRKATDIEILFRMIEGSDAF